MEEFVMKRKNIHIYLIILTTFFFACSNCETLPTAKFFDTIMVNVTVDTFFLNLRTPNADKAPVTCEIHSSDTLNNVILISANLFGVFLRGDSIVPNKSAALQHDTLYVRFDYLSSETTKQRSMPIVTSTGTPCGDPGPPTFLIESVSVQVPKNKILVLITNNGDWKLK